MANKLTQQRKITEFDRLSVNAGDIVEFDEYETPLFGKKRLSHRRVALVERVDSTVIWLITQEPGVRAVYSLRLPVQRAHEMRVIYRSYYNAREDENYGKQTEN